MIKMTIYDALCRLCKATNKYGLYLSFDPEGDFPMTENQKAVPFLDLNEEDLTDSEDWQCVADEHMFVLCEDYEECYRLFESVVGDEGPTKTNPYDGPCRVFCLTINNKGEIENTNT